MKKIIPVLVALSSVLFVSVNAMANSPTVKDSMKLMSKSYRAVMNDKNIDSFKKDLSSFKMSVQEAQRTSLPGADKTTFDSGMKQLLDQVNIVETTAEQKGLAPAQQEAKKLRNIMEQFHSKLGV
ncbi:cytochrome b562 [Phytobacter diazotrophicus]|uniref:cytochrome b562 n=1 Tax=Phytobacter diazotrophicus TaxID=395631 RepID=UPI0029355A6E|nr:cytochrome b562 [Phytobacter diazotrophicus]MDV2873999.1 cytochrome b562 [Phytobacter diazotrophicus]